MTMDFHAHVNELVQRIRYKENYTLVAEIDQADPEGRVYLQVHCQRPDVYTGAPGLGKGGKAYLSPHMVDGEIIRRAFSLFMAYEEHECREWFKLDDRSVFGPHISVDALWVAAASLEQRP